MRGAPWGKHMQSRIALPRRHLIGCGLVSLAFAKAAFAENQNGFEPLPAQVKIKDRQLTTAVRINGKGPFHFVVDTGADHSVISEDVAKVLRLPVGHPVTVQGIIRAVSAPSVPVAELRFGAVVRDNLQMPVLPRALLKADGFLGLDAIGKHRVIFDFKKRTLRVSDCLPTEWVDHTSTESLIAAPGDDGHLRSFACRVDSVVTTAFLDTGAEVSVGNEALRQALMRVGPGYAGDRDIELTGITGGSRTGKVVKVSTILLGNLEFSGCEIGIADLDIFKIWDLADQPALLIGLNFLREFQTVSIDYGRKEFRLKLAAASPWVNRKRQG
jgi:predicted aspartyl protease